MVPSTNQLQNGSVTLPFVIPTEALAKWRDLQFAQPLSNAKWRRYPLHCHPTLRCANSVDRVAISRSSHVCVIAQQQRSEDEIVVRARFGIACLLPYCGTR